jgi:hypothetical protein
MAAVAGLSRDPIADSGQISAGILTDFRRWPTKSSELFVCAENEIVGARGIVYRGAADIYSTIKRSSLKIMHGN